MSFTSSNLVSVGDPTEKSHYDVVFDNTKYNKDLILGDNAEGTDALPQSHDGTNGVKVKYSDLNFTASNLNNIEVRQYSSLTDRNHASDHVAGDSIQSATASAKGLMTAAQATTAKYNRRGWTDSTYIPNGDTGEFFDIGNAVFPNLPLRVTMHIKSDRLGATTISFSEINNNIDGEKTFYVYNTSEDSITTLNVINPDGIYDTGELTFFFKIESNMVKIKSTNTYYSYYVTCFIESIDDGYTAILS